MLLIPKTSKPNVLVTAGPTREYIDPVRFISNLSSGIMGYAIAEIAKKDANVLLISGPVQPKQPKKIKTIFIETAKEMHKQVLKYIRNVDIFISCAAVCDWRPQKTFRHKIKKTNLPNPTLKLIQNPDILTAVTKMPAHIRPKILVGFALETEDTIKNAIKKLKSKNLDLIIANSFVSVGGKHAEGYIIAPTKKIKKVNLTTKKQFAKIVWSNIKNIYDQEIIKRKVN